MAKFPGGFFIEDSNLTRNYTNTYWLQRFQIIMAQSASRLYAKQQLGQVLYWACTSSYYTAIATSVIWHGMQSAVNIYMFNRYTLCTLRIYFAIILPCYLLVHAANNHNLVFLATKPLITVNRIWDTLTRKRKHFPVELSMQQWKQ